MWIFFGKRTEHVSTVWSSAFCLGGVGEKWWGCFEGVGILVDLVSTILQLFLNGHQWGVVFGGRWLSQTVPILVHPQRSCLYAIYHGFNFMSYNANHHQLMNPWDCSSRLWALTMPSAFEMKANKALLYLCAAAHQRCRLLPKGFGTKDWKQRSV